MQSFHFKRNNFDFIRLVAALQVCIVHGYEHFKLTQASLLIEFIKIFPGVPIFFVVSGFLISASFERSVSLRVYFENRFLRIYPALWGCFVFSIFILFYSSNIQFELSSMLKWIFAQITFFQFYNPDFIREYGVGVLNGSLWTIPVELQFYLVLPVIYLILRRFKWNGIVLALVMIFFVLINFYFITFKNTIGGLYFKLLGVTVFPYLYMFFLGVLLQRNLNFVERFLFGNFISLFFLYLFFVAVVYYSGGVYQGNYINPLLSVLLALLTISAAYSGPNFNRMLKGNDISYGMYIYHMVIVNFLIESSYFDKYTNFILMILITVLVALFSWRFIEKPMLLLKRKSINTRT